MCGEFLEGFLKDSGKFEPPRIDISTWFGATDGEIDLEFDRTKTAFL